MTEIHQAKCDKCGKTEDMSKSFTGYDYLNPDGWIYIDYALVNNGATICDMCRKELKKQITKWMQNNKQ